MNDNLYNPPENNSASQTEVKYKDGLIKFLLLFMLLSKLYVISIFIGILAPEVMKENVQVYIVLYQTIHQVTYYLLSTVCIIGILCKRVIFLYTLIFLFFVNLGVYVFKGTSVYQSVFDPVFILIFLSFAFFVKPNRWYFIFSRLSDNQLNIGATKKDGVS